jgi:hypothetical protein
MMGRVSPEDRRRQILDVLRRYPDGADAGTIAGALGVPPITARLLAREAVHRGDAVCEPPIDVDLRGRGVTRVFRPTPPAGVGTIPRGER